MTPLDVAWEEFRRDALLNWGKPLERAIDRHREAIEAEARAQRDAELRAAVEGLPRITMAYPPDDPVHRSAVLRLLSDHAHADTPSREGGEGT